MRNLSVITKIILSILYIICLFDMPYVYFQFVRFSSMIGFAVLAFICYKNKRYVELILYIGLIVLFQPIIKIALGRTIWNIVDIIIGTFLIISIFTIDIFYNKNKNAQFV